MSIEKLILSQKGTIPKKHMVIRIKMKA